MGKQAWVKNLPPRTNFPQLSHHSKRVPPDRVKVAVAVGEVIVITLSKGKQAAPFL